VEILAQSSTAFVLTHNFQGTHILGASRGRLSDSVASCYSRNSHLPPIDYRVLLRQRFRKIMARHDTRGLSRSDPGPELDTPSYHVLENALVLSQNRHSLQPFVVG